MKAELKSLHSPDISNLERGPGDAANFGALFQAIVGPAGEPGEESFDIIVCTPSWLAEEVKREGHVWGRHYLFVSSYGLRAIEREIRRICDSIEGATWAELAERLGRYGRWEFEDYQS